ncbi:MAG TPA: hypothetical protein QGF58_03970 [Myxococcota bacterium]|nr:hypothetical protein [Myxococcota bacterium]
MRALSLWLLAVLVHAAWALTVPTPVDWDPAYYSAVAGHILAGDGAVTGSAVFLSQLPESLPAVADLHWAPLPSRVLLPGLALWTHGDQLVTVCILATWAPLAWAIARELGAGPRTALWAGVMAASGLGYARMGASPDSIALAGALGGVALLALLRDRWGVLALAAVGLVLTRGDGFLVGLVFAAFVRRRSAGVVVAIATVGALGAWAMRCQAFGGSEWVEARQGLMAAADYGAWLRDEPATTTARPLTRLPMIYGLAFAALVPLLAAVGFRRRAAPLFILALVLPLSTALLAPALAESGTLYRSGAILVSGACALASLGIERLARLRDLDLRFAYGVLGGGVLLTSVALGARNVTLKPSLEVACPELPDEVVFSDEPLLLELRCGASAVWLPAGLSTEKREEVRKRYAITRVVRVHGGS